jgi:hypothetical protein
MVESNSRKRHSETKEKLKPKPVVKLKLCGTKKYQITILVGARK